MRMFVDPGFETRSIEPWARSTRSLSDRGVSNAAPFDFKSGTVVGNAKLELVIRDCEPDFDPFRPAVTNGVSDRFTKQLLEVELKPDRDCALIAVRRDAAIDGPLLAKALGKRAELGDRVHKFKILVAAQGKQESADFPRFLHQQPFQLVKVGIDL